MQAKVLKSVCLFIISSMQARKSLILSGFSKATNNDVCQRGIDGPSSKPVFLPLTFQVFQTLHATGQSSMVRDWVLLSLSNFTQRTPVAMAMWSLSCFFVSASTSQWISALYPELFPHLPRLLTSGYCVLTHASVLKLTKLKPTYLFCRCFTG